MSDTSILTPREAGFYLPAEWAPHAATWFAWPHCSETWPGHLREAETTTARCVAHLAQAPAESSERIEILVQQPSDAERVSKILHFWDTNMDRVRFHPFPTNDVWIRDYGPTFLVRDDIANDGLGTLALVDWRFDGWGGKGATYYGAHDGLDNQVPQRIAQALDIHRFEAKLVLEGGAFDHNGEGTLLTTRNCLLHRQPQSPETANLQTLESFEHAFERYLGIQHVIWLDGVDFTGDDTEGHIDNLSRFVAADTIVTVVGNDSSDPLYEQLELNYKQLQNASDAKGQPLNIVRLPLPKPVWYNSIFEGKEGKWNYPASYANFYIGNNCVLVPIFSDKNDAMALNILSECFPKREIIPVDCSHYILGQGAIHCSTQQQPAHIQSKPALFNAA